jgi:hypothetical protein
MTVPRPQLPDDLKTCDALIEQLRTELHAVMEQIARLESATAKSRDAAAEIAHLEELFARYLATITENKSRRSNDWHPTTRY